MDTFRMTATFILIPVIYSFMSMTAKMVDSMNNYVVKETSDMYMIIERLEDLEKEVKELKKMKQTLFKEVKKSDIEKKKVKQENKQTETDKNIDDSYFTLVTNLQTIDN